MWRRSLEEMSPSKKMADWEDLDTKRNSVNIAAALPPQYFDQPPEYDEIQQAAKEIRLSNPWMTAPGPQSRGAQGQQRQDIPHIKTEPPREQHGYYQNYNGYQYVGKPPAQRRDVTIDNLLDHPMLRPR